MHFVKKVPTTQEQKEAKEREHAVKLRAYCMTRDKIFRKRLQGELDFDMLALTGRLLKANPDIATFWNIRREVISIVCKKVGNGNETTPVVHEDNLLMEELSLTEECLKKNCKSYNAWFHRGWVLAHMSKPDIEKELLMCEHFLSLDERNFHGWDYRRFIAQLGRRGPEEELEFSTRLINNNFSNYSSWHYRSSLLPSVFPNPNGKGLVSDDVLGKELELASNAFFVDPEDQSAWVYAEWLLKLQLPDRLDNASRADNPSIVVVLITENNSGYIVVDRPMTLGKVHEMCFSPAFAGRISLAAISEFSEPRSAVAFSFTSVDVPHELLFSDSLRDLIRTDCPSKYVNVNFLRDFYVVHQTVISDALRKALNSAVEKCECLINEGTKESFVGSKINKWPVFIQTLCLIAIDPAHYFNEIISNFEKLKNECDPQRSLMYGDMAAKLQINEALRTPSEHGTTPFDKLISNESESFTLRLPSLGIHDLRHLVFLSALIRVLDLSDNLISDVRTIGTLPYLTHLTLDGNPFTSLQGLSFLKQLEFLSVARSGIRDCASVVEALSIRSLKRFVFCETVLAMNDEECEKLYRKNAETGGSTVLFRHWL